jgi:drug/metabolite transporter (DMT)-like permease
LPPDPFTSRLRRFWSLEKALVIGGVLALLGLGALIWGLLYWNGRDFGRLDPRDSLRIIVPAATALIMSMQVVFAALFASILLIRRRPEGRLAAPREYTPTQRV